jgi:hypothetical protein
LRRFERSAALTFANLFALSPRLSLPMILAGTTWFVDDAGTARFADDKELVQTT